jgi:hypothetical protein
MSAFDLKTYLANRITLYAEACEIERAKKPYTPDEYRDIADNLAASLVCLDELERIWESAFGERPSILDVSRAKSKEN